MCLFPTIDSKMHRCLRVGVAAVGIVAIAGATFALDPPPLLRESDVAAIANEVSGETAKRNLEFVARQHRMRASRGFRAAAEFIADQCRAYGLDDVRIEEYPVDGNIFYGTQRSRPAWDAEFAELWELREGNDGWERAERIASWDAMPITLAQDSESGEAVADLIDVGAGTSEDDYEGRDVEGKLVLASAQPGPVAALAVDKHGAVGVISYAQNQRTAWWKEDENLVRWGHLGSFRDKPTFAFMISLKRARAYQTRLGAGKTVRFEANVRAGRHPGNYSVVTATIQGKMAELDAHEIIYSCHLDHQRPGANDNASGSVAILEVARTLAKLIHEERLERPARTIRFIWPPEIEGTMARMISEGDRRQVIDAAIHLDMVGGGPNTKAVFHVTRGPGSLPSFVSDVAEAFGTFANEQTAAYAGGEDVPYPLVSPEGGKEALLAQMVDYTSGSDHDVYAEGSFRVPVIYLNDWPDRYIHTNFDAPGNIDPTKLERAAFIAAASGYFLARVTWNDERQLWPLVRANSLSRVATTLQLIAVADPEQASHLRAYRLWYEMGVLASTKRFFEPSNVWGQYAVEHRNLVASILGPSEAPSPTTDAGAIVYERTSSPLGPLSVFGYDYLRAHYGEKETDDLGLLSYAGNRGGGHEYAYEALNFVNGKRSTADICSFVSAIYGPIPLDLVADYLNALEGIDVIRRTDTASGAPSDGD